MQKEECKNTCNKTASKIILKQNRSNEEHSKMQSKCKEGKGSEGTDQEFATDKYNHPKFYLGIVLDENTLYFKFTYNINKMSRKLARKGKQIIDTAKLVYTCFGHVTIDIISMKTINKESRNSNKKLFKINIKS
ncbi:hypothetical protein ACJMK2_030404 [Sinanodonta woodiana]|uniref:Uncharacterized protein n=1 Tax=Sinanodonta woodiana TaxID=1069815 RepID=A0ABD3XD30_SINWO